MSPTPPSRSQAQRYVCIHGHFYQPPRENAWLEAIEVQDSARPYHDWNQRINAECYAPNASARILDGQDRIVRIVNNYERISFNFGPTLLSWLEHHDVPTYNAILTADHSSRRRFGGHGSALAQAYNHAILPLCNARDKRTQVLWGLADFRKRFGREAEGMWLPETAADLDSLEVLAAEGVRFTILAPRQAAAVRKPKSKSFEDVTGARIDPRRAYRLPLPSGRDMALFFYDGPISQAVAFERLLARGDRFAAKLVSAFDAQSDEPQLVHLATDGETYGHHHAFGEMALSYALQEIDEGDAAQITNYGQFLALHPPQFQVRIVEPSSWSCEHGVGRWSRDCGCKAGHNADWDQRWRRPLRNALDTLRDDLVPVFEREAAKLLDDPWEARNRYIDVVLDRSESGRTEFLRRHARRPLDPGEISRVLSLLEMQRNAMLMFTSCGWFFDEVSGIETVQILQYAARALELAQGLDDGKTARRFLARLSYAPSNIAEFRDGRRLYEMKVEPTRADLRKVGANHAAGLLFDEGRGRAEIPAYRVECPEPRLFQSGGASLVLGRLRVTSTITLEREDLDFAFFYPGKPLLDGGIRAFAGEAAHRAMLAEVGEAFERSDAEGVVGLLRRHFPDSHGSLQTLFRDEQRRIVRHILESTLTEVEDVYLELYDRHAPLRRLLAELETGQPRALRVAAELAAGKRLLTALNEPLIDPEQLEVVLKDATAQGVALDETEIGFAARAGIDRLLRHVAARPADTASVRRATHAVRLVHALPFHVDLRSAQNTFYRMTPKPTSDALTELGNVLGIAPS